MWRYVGSEEDVELEEAVRVLHEKHDPIRLHRTKLAVWSRGFLSGVAFTMFVVSIFAMVSAYDPRSQAIQSLAAWSYPFFRSSFFLSFTALCYGMCIFVWRRLELDLGTIFSIDGPDSAAVRYQWILEFSQATMIVTFFAFCLYIDSLVFYNILWYSQFADVMPVIAFLAPIVAWLWCGNRIPCSPWIHTQGSKHARYALLTKVIAPTLVPVGTPTFAHTFVADVLCSMPKLFSDLSIATFRILRLDTAHRLPAIQTVLDGLPFVLRFLQSLRLAHSERSGLQAFNAGKYAMAIALVVTSVLKTRYKNSSPHGDAARILWLLLSVACTLYNFLWDILFDWGFLRLYGLGFFEDLPELTSSSSSSDVVGKRRRRYHGVFVDYYPRWIFYVAVVLDGLFRLGWAVYVSPHQDIVEQHVILLLGSVEIFRRFLWSIFRVVHEQIKLELRLLDQDHLGGAGHDSTERSRLSGIHSIGSRKGPR